MPFESRQPHIL